jgi:RNA recognition motif-containing protein
VEGRRLFVGNLPFEIGGKPIAEAALHDLFGKFGEVVDVQVMRDSVTKRPRGYAFVEFETEEEAKQALDMNDVDFHGRLLRVNPAAPRNKNGAS